MIPVGTFETIRAMLLIQSMATIASKKLTCKGGLLESAETAQQGL